MPTARTEAQIRTILRVVKESESSQEAAGKLGMTAVALRCLLYRLRRLGWRDAKSFKGNRRRLPGPPVGGK